MSIISMPYVSSVSGDRKYTASELAKLFAGLFASGVSTDDGALLCTKVADSRQIAIASGFSFLAGHFAISDATETVTLDVGDANYPRIDTVVFESNNNTQYRSARFTVVKGTPAASPAAPALTQTEAVWQTPLANITVPAGATTLNSATLTDVRKLCVGKHEHEDFTSLRIKSNLAPGQLGVANIIALPNTSSDPDPSSLPDGTLVVKYVP